MSARRWEERISQVVHRLVDGRYFDRPPDFAVEMLRPDDLLSLHFAAYNLHLDPAAAPAAQRLVRIDPGADAFVAFVFPPQSIAEEVFFDSRANPDDPPPAGEVPGPPPVPHRMAGPSRLVFRVPPAVASLPYDLQGLLDWSGLDLAVVPVAAPGGGDPPAVVEPSALQTAIEMPYRLILSPAGGSPWLHALQAVSHAGWTELWHTRLARALSKPGAIGEIDVQNPAAVRAVWSPDFSPGSPPAPLPDGSNSLSPLTAEERHQIVALTSDFTDYTVLQRFYVVGPDGRPHRSPPGPTSYQPEPVQAERLMLTTLGGWLHSRGSWQIDPTNLPTFHDGGDSLDVSEWVHLATQGRDHYVRIVKEGFLYPFGHRAAKVEVTERRFEAIASGDEAPSPAAYLRKYEYIIVRQPQRTYTGAPYTYGGREMPLPGVRLTTLVTPHINPAAGLITARSFWVFVDGQPLPFGVVAEDVAGNRIEFTAALIFVEANDVSAGQVGANLPLIQNAYRTSGDRRKCPIPGQKVAFAPAGAPGADDTTFTTDALSFDTETAPAAPGRFLPYLFTADVHVPAVEQLLGTNTTSSIGLYQAYLDGGLDPHAGVFAELVQEVGGTLVRTPTLVNFSADKAGGMATPNLNISALSRSLGPIAGTPDAAAAGQFVPKDFFPDLSGASLFGVVKVQDLIPLGDINANAPTITIEALPPNLPTRVVTTLDWHPPVHKADAGILTFDPGDGNHLDIHGVLTKPMGSTGIPTSNFEGRLADFQLAFGDVIAVRFASFSFKAISGQKTDVAVDIAPSNGIEFKGPLVFINDLRQVIPPGAFGAGASLDISPTGVHVGYGIALPPLTIAVFSLQQISFSAGLTLPFADGRPLFDFAFAERSHPFLLTVGIFGGGGFFHLQVGTDGLKQLEVALEFGGNFAFDIGVASGGVHIMAGIYFALHTDDAGKISAILTGYLRMGGEVSVLGLISVSVEFLLSFSYDTGRNKATGRATLTVAVHVAFFSTSVDLTVERSFGGKGDPTFAQLMSADDWHDYAAAFV